MWGTRMMEDFFRLQLVRFWGCLPWFVLCLYLDGVCGMGAVSWQGICPCWHDRDQPKPKKKVRFVS